MNNLVPEEDRYVFSLLPEPASSISQNEKAALKEELCALGQECLDPLPNYQVFSQDPDAFADRILVLARLNPSSVFASQNAAKETRRGREKGRLIGFVSAILLLPVPGVEGRVLHTGLTCILPSERRSNMLVLNRLARLFFYVLGEERLVTDKPACLNAHSETGGDDTSSSGEEQQSTEEEESQLSKGVWITSLAEVPSSLVHISKFCSHVFPSPSVSSPTVMHLHIADRISYHHRSDLLIAPSATFSPSDFVFRGSNDARGQGKCFIKDVDDERFWHRERAVNDFYRSLFRRGMGDEVLQVGWLDVRHLLEVAKLQARLGRFVDGEGGMLAGL